MLGSNLKDAMLIQSRLIHELGQFYEVEGLTKQPTKLSIQTFESLMRLQKDLLWKDAMLLHSQGHYDPHNSEIQCLFFLHQIF